MRTPVWLMVLFLAARLSLAAQAPGDLPPVSFVCPMPEHAQVLEDAAGKCPLCQMALVPVRIDQAFACPNHPAVIASKTGLCPLDKRPLMPVVVSLYWTCAGKPDEHLTEPGRCSDGTARKAVREQRAHGDHNPKHGGQFFMAADKWHHVEATHPREGTLRVFLYDNFSKPIAVKGISGRAVTKEVFDSRTAVTRELEVVALAASRDGQSFDARVNLKTLPAKVTLKMRFDARLPEERFDFVFESYSVDPGGAAAPAATRAAAAVAPKASAPAPRPQPRPAAAAAAAASAPPSATRPVAAPDAPAAPAAVVSQPAAVSQPAPDAATAVLRAAESLPASAPELVAMLRTTLEEVTSLVERGQLGAIYVPALLGKDVALKLEEHLHELPAQARPGAAGAVRRLVLAAWQLDAFGDMGDQVKVALAYGRFSAAATALSSAYAPR